MASSEITVDILKDIRDGVRETNHRLDGTNKRLDSMEHALSQRLDLVETTLLDLAEQHRFLVRYTGATAERESRLEPRLSVLEGRVDKLESK